jgi:hypothetical protein
MEGTGKCKKQFPKPFAEDTTMGKRKYPVYRNIATQRLTLMLQFMFIKQYRTVIIIYI